MVVFFVLVGTRVLFSSASPLLYERNRRKCIRGAVWFVASSLVERGDATVFLFSLPMTWKKVGALFPCTQTDR